MEMYLSFLNYCSGGVLLLLAICWGNSGWGGHGLMPSLIRGVDDFSFLIFFLNQNERVSPVQASGLITATLNLQFANGDFWKKKSTFPKGRKGNLRVHQTLTSFVSIAVMVSHCCKSSFFVDKAVCAAVLPSIFLCLSSLLIYLFCFSGRDISSFQSVDVAFLRIPCSLA